MNLKFESISESNIKDALSIYNWYVLHSTATFHLSAIDEKELTRMVSMGHEKYKSYVILLENNICGFCYISQFRYKEAYDKSAEITLYLDQSVTGKGIGKITLDHLENKARNKGIKNLVAVITEGNTASINLFEKQGYFKVGHLRTIGEKFGEALDVVSYQKII